MSKSPHSYRSQAVTWCLPEVFSGYSEPRAFVNSRENSLNQVQGGLCGGQTEQRPGLHVQAGWRLHLTQGGTQLLTAVTGGQCPGSKHAGSPHTFGGAQGITVDRVKEATVPELVKLDPAQGGPSVWLTGSHSH